MCWATQPLSQYELFSSPVLHAWIPAARVQISHVVLSNCHEAGSWQFVRHGKSMYICKVPSPDQQLGMNGCPSALGQGNIRRISANLIWHLI